MSKWQAVCQYSLLLGMRACAVKLSTYGQLFHIYLSANNVIRALFGIGFIIQFYHSFIMLYRFYHLFHISTWGHACVLSQHPPQRGVFVCFHEAAHIS